MQNYISSTQNSRIKEIIQLKEKSRIRKKKGEFLVEGQREITLAISGGYTIKSIYFFGKIISLKEIYSLIDSKGEIEVYELSKEVYEKIAYRETTEGVIAIVKTKENTLDAIQFKSENPLILIGEGIEKPGNMGALLRTADASNLDAVIIANPKADFYNPNVIRSSVGCVFTNQLASGTTKEIISWLKEKNIQINCAALTASKPYHEVKYTSGTAIVVGTEATGLTEEWLENSSQNIIIPMQGKIDSMNVSVAAAIVIFEAKRQRNFK